MWRLDRERGPAQRPWLVVTVGVVACLYCVGVALGQSHDLGFKAFVALLLTTPLYALVRTTRTERGVAQG